MQTWNCQATLRFFWVLYGLSYFFYCVQSLCKFVQTCNASICNFFVVVVKNCERSLNIESRIGMSKQGMGKMLSTIFWT
jgi:hypothetical protein